MTIKPVNLLALRTGYVESNSLSTLIMRQTQFSFQSVEAALLHIGAVIHNTLANIINTQDPITHMVIEREVCNLLARDNNSGGMIAHELFETGWVFGLGWPFGETYRKDLTQIVEVFEHAEVLVADAYFGSNPDECYYKPSARLDFWERCIDAPKGVKILETTADWLDNKDKVNNG